MKFEEAFNQLTKQNQEKLQDCNSIEEVLQLFSDNGIFLTAKDIEDSFEVKTGELSDDDLELVTGGIDPTWIIQEVLKKGLELLKKTLGDK